MKNSNVRIVLTVFLLAYTVGCPEGWSEFQENCYKIFQGFTDLGSAADAITRCNLLSAHLPIVKDVYTQDFITGLIESPGVVWLGVNDIEQKGVLRWIDGSNLIYANWFRQSAQNAPYDYRCVLLQFNGFWHKVHCNSKSVAVACVLSKESTMTSSDQCSWELECKANSRKKRSDTIGGFRKNTCTSYVVIILINLLVLPYLHDSKPIRSKEHKRNKWTTYPTHQVVREIGSCVVNGKVYKPGQVIDSMYDMLTNHCSSIYCNQEGRVVSWENWNCLTTPTPFPTTTQPPPPTTYITTTC